MGLSELGSKLVEPARWIVIMGIAFTLANTVLFFIAPPERTGAANPTARQTARTPDTRPAVSINAILNRNLFGVAGETAVADTGLPAVETRLPLELLGVFVADVDAESAAIIAQKGKAGGQLFVVGDTVKPGNAELLEVHADHVVLRRAGNRETLRFPEVASSPVATRTAVQRASTSRATTQPVQAPQPAETPRDFVASYRDRIEADPEGTLKEIGITPVSEGNAQGYRLDSAAAGSPYLSQTGLQPGDVVLSVNGQPVGNIQQDRHQLDNILAEGSARIEVQRGTRRFFVTASLKQ